MAAAKTYSIPLAMPAFAKFKAFNRRERGVKSRKRRVIAAQSAKLWQHPILKAGQLDL
jgi:hypothetical protein